MSRFDTKAWRDRAWERFKRASDPRAPESRQAGAPAEWNRDINSICDLEAIVSWCEDRGLEVVFTRRAAGIYQVDSKKISVASNLRPHKQVCVMLHECGHYLVGREEDHDKFGMGYPQTDPEVTKTFRHRVAVLEEELEAWHRGWKLAKRLELLIERDTFDAIKLDCIRSYLKWTLKPGSMSEEV